MSKNLLNLAISIAFACITGNAIAEQKVTVFAAASLTNAISEIVTDYESANPQKIQTSLAASSMLAKQIENGAPADIFISADTKWMNYLQDKDLLKTDSKINLLGNRLVLIAPKGKSFKVDMKPEFNFTNAFAGKLCTGEVESVPAGIYAKQSLKALNWWDAIKARIVGSQDVRAALTLVERAECDAGIVYETDAKVTEKVETIAAFPDASHDAIVYPLSLTKNAKPEASSFYDYLKSEKAKAVFVKYGFTVLKP
ncbi:MULTISPECIES: molybdate ABC transporter substrate-binding protein [Methylotenera]|uniref:molybdate ABC transporter substrate-binding protein n=1 Tax=Methylotenera TaxID=359407 RepID=UPI0003773C51|nr:MULTISPECIES: molybdate ABC transporter substrate-binding protein [Methylotenera]